MYLPSSVYQSQIRRKILKPDAQQLKCITQCFDPLHDRLQSLGDRARANPLLMNDVKGLYLWGGVGCGKTFMMDLFRESLPSNINCCRMHFHSFMKDVHRFLHASRAAGNQGKSTDIADAVHNVTRNANVLCFDEMMVTDVADAMILKRIFRHLYTRGLCLVTTSNRSPQELYQNGLNREQFLPFVDLLLDHCDVFNMNADIDYRLTENGSQAVKGDVYFYPSSDSTQKANFEKKFRELTKGKTAVRTSIESEFNREVKIPRAVLSNSVCRFTFTELFREERGAVDYETMSQKFHTIFIENFPKLSIKQSNEVRRMINALDIFYQYSVKLVILADAEPQNLCIDTETDSGTSDEGVFHGLDNSMMREIYSEEFRIFNTEDERFMIKRALSRLTEMKSPKYMQDKWKGKG